MKKKRKKGQPVIIVKGTNCSGKSTLPLQLRKWGWDEKAVDKRNEESANMLGVCYTRFWHEDGRKLFVVGKYGAKGGGADGLTKDECLQTLEFLWDKRGAIYVEGQNIADTLTTHPLFMLWLNDTKHKPSFNWRGEVPHPRTRGNRDINVVCLSVPLKEIFKRLKKRTPDKVLKNGGAKTKQKHESVMRQYRTMLGWSETKTNKLFVMQYHNTAKKSNLVYYMMQLLGVRKNQ